MSNKPPYERTVIYSLDDIPTHFASEDEEREFWWTHEFSDELWDSLPDASAELDELRPTRHRTKIQSWGEVPSFVSEADELAWWDDHVPSEALLDALPDRPILSTRIATLRGFVEIGRAQAAKKRRVS